MANKTELMQFNVELQDREKIESRAIKDGMKVPDMLRAGISFYVSFDPAFISIMERAAKISKLDVPTVIQNLLTFYLAKDQAEYNIFGPTRTYGSAFRFDNGALVTGERLHELVYAEEEKAAKDILKKFKRASENKKDVCIPRGEVREISRAISAKGRE